ncbi:DnaD domain protein [Faecalicatena contorta]|uniref:DnaD domain protein n=1 Tax=Faecalicatena contorta TaxID=39482 RepID=UPI001F1C3CA9|nr:DnaD domain protein [Faecalicatena contorta]MCF2681877.1 DnaD domain protein [Faecalicatena contorta]
MKELTLTNYAQVNTTVLDNEFIDRYMVKANGEYVKVYLLLLRHMDESSGMLSVSEMADLLECTEKDILRALKYWKSQGLINYSEDSPKNAEVGKNEPTTDMPQEKPQNIQQYRTRKDRKEFKELLFVAEQYLGKTLCATDIDMITYFFDELHMSTELIEYLIEYCVENGHKSMHYIRKVALSWHEQNIKTVDVAKSTTVLYNKNYYSILHAYGIKGRGPAASEIAYIRKWTDEYHFSQEIILEACDRTMNMIHQPSFDYTDSILKKWFDKNVHTLKDIEVLDENHLREKERQKRQAVRPAASSKGSTGNKFNNFDGRSYDMSELERKLVQQ